MTDIAEYGYPIAVEVDWAGDGRYRHALSDVSQRWTRIAIGYGASRTANPQRPTMDAGRGTIVLYGTEFIPGVSEVFDEAHLRDRHRCRIRLSVRGVPVVLALGWLMVAKRAGFRAAAFAWEGLLEQAGREDVAIVQAELSASMTAPAIAGHVLTGYGLSTIRNFIDPLQLGPFRYAGPLARYVSEYCRVGGAYPCATGTGGLNIARPTAHLAGYPTINTQDATVLAVRPTLNVDQIFNAGAIEFPPHTFGAGDAGSRAVTAGVTTDAKTTGQLPASARTIVQTFTLPAPAVTGQGYVDFGLTLESVQARVIAKAASAAPVHTDTSHTDIHGDAIGPPHTDTHGDSAIGTHGDTPHVDIHGDRSGVSHLDTHADTDHVNSHGDASGVHRDTHGDTDHVNTHGDTAHQDSGPHIDRHGDTRHLDTHGDRARGHQDTHADTDHLDSHGDRSSPHRDTHGDTARVNSHGDRASTHLDTHADTDHVNSHGDRSTPHLDTHGDTAHVNSHGDRALGHQDTHTDTAHVNSHGDVRHLDFTTHVDRHGDRAHVNAPHGDRAHSNASPPSPRPHSDRAHIDRDHVNTPRVNTHSDRTTHADLDRVNTHTDTAHVNSHGDRSTPHLDTHGDTARVNTHGDRVSGHQDTHADTDHVNSHGDQTAPHIDRHGDTRHVDTHGDRARGHQDTHADTDHVNSHGDRSSPHLDTHGDTARVNSHGDNRPHTDTDHVNVPHRDRAHVNSHGDLTSAHLDTHADVDHVNSHGDASSGAHLDTHGDTDHVNSHGDTPAPSPTAGSPVYGETMQATGFQSPASTVTAQVQSDRSVRVTVTVVFDARSWPGIWHWTQISATGTPVSRSGSFWGTSSEYAMGAVTDAGLSRIWGLTAYMLVRWKLTAAAGMHADVPHGDGHLLLRWQNFGHFDTAHGDEAASHTDAASGGLTPPHADHDDTAHQDRAHGDRAHANASPPSPRPHVNTAHVNVSHVNVRGDHADQTYPVASRVIVENLGSITEWGRRELTYPPWFHPSAVAGLQARIDELATPRYTWGVDFAIIQPTGTLTRAVAGLEPGTYVRLQNQGSSVGPDVDAICLVVHAELVLGQGTPIKRVTVLDTGDVP